MVNAMIFASLLLAKGGKSILEAKQSPSPVPPCACMHFAHWHFSSKDFLGHVTNFSGLHKFITVINSSSTLSLSFVKLVLIATSYNADLCNWCLFNGALALSRSFQQCLENGGKNRYCTFLLTIDRSDTCLIADGTWTTWQEWSRCTRTCGDSFQGRSRRCGMALFGGTRLCESELANRTEVRSCLPPVPMCDTRK